MQHLVHLSNHQITFQGQTKAIPCKTILFLGSNRHVYLSNHQVIFQFPGVDQTNTLRSKIIQSQTILLVGLNHLVYFANHRVTFQGKTKTIPCGIESYNNIQYCYWGQTIMSICPVSMREQGGQGAMCSCLSQCLHLAICSVSGC